MLEKLQQEVFEANRLLPEYGLVTFTWGNVSAYDSATGLMVIKPSGVPYDTMKTADMVVPDEAGKMVEGTRKPSSCTPAYLYLYRSFRNVRSLLHTHSHWAAVFAQAGIPIPVLGTTHADYFADEVPVTRLMIPGEIHAGYESETDKVIVEQFENKNSDMIPGALVHSHGPFTWGRNTVEAVLNAVVLKTVARMAFHTLALEGNRVKAISPDLLKKHFFRKHGAGPVTARFKAGVPGGELVKTIALFFLKKNNNK
ncbi:L-ribulose-5-phosphate 4-epimerase [Niabella ginsenosidivorans]|uniref:L-ribulose-5-phosphate 4-epimerase n=1 Tax=Niabella ginsenosidivorans TaxID=1176587 RepID=A0A1A9I7P6_9BACT|nr:L-ribulose-5-phosphate 4-epimerase AraD [Niabella ginsenosidivorans]ANH82730.1 L-ribulose-5-phosphate 4-epimerase [Niabella ginsenosidivorans]